MTSILLAYICIAWDAKGCASEEVWKSDSWVGQDAPRQCNTKRREAMDLARDRGLKNVRFECESSSTEADFQPMTFTY